MTRVELLQKVGKLYGMYRDIARTTGINRTNYMRCIIITLFQHKISEWIDNNQISQPLPKKIKLSCNLNGKELMIKRKDIINVFNQLGLKVTRYTREYGKTIVHFEEASNSQ